MKSLRTELASVHTPGSGAVRFRDFFWTPPTLSAALHAMAPAAGFQQVLDPHFDTNWTEECQGAAWDGANWLFSSNGSQEFHAPVFGSVLVGSSPVAIYTFAGTQTKWGDDDWAHRFVIADVKPMNAAVDRVPRIPPPDDGGAGIYHLGAIASFDGMVYADHFNDDGGQVLVLRNNGGALSYDHWITLDKPPGVGRVGMVAINPQNRTFVTAGGDVNVDRLFCHDLHGRLVTRPDGTPRQLRLDPPITDSCYVQGGGVSDRGHLYVASGNGDRPSASKYQNIYIYSILTGRRLGVVPVLAEDSGQELEGICLAPVTRGGTPCQLHAVLLENVHLAKDNIFFKSFAAADPALV